MVDHKICWLLMLIGIFSLSSCFDVMEEINVKANGSGDMVVTLNLSQSKSKVASVLLLDSVNGHKVPSRNDLKAKLEEAAAELRKMPGISQVGYSADFDNYIASIHFSFEKVENLNQLTKGVLNAFKIKAGGNSTYQFDAGRGLFSRHYAALPQGQEMFNKLKPEDQAVFKQAYYTSIYRFDSPITATSNPRAKLSPSKKAVMLRTGITELIPGTVSINNRIQLAK